MQRQREFRAALIALLLSGVAAGCGVAGGEGSSATKPKASTRGEPAATGAPVDAPAATDAPATAEAPPTTTATTEATIAPAEPEGRGEVIEEPVSGPTDQLVTVQDPVNNAFSVGVPDGWDGLVYSTVEGQVTHEVVNTVSPDGKTILFIGDPKIPSYWNPATANPITVSFTEQLDFMELRSYTPAPEYMPAYVEEKFDQLPGFAVTEVVEDPSAESSVAQSFVDAGLPAPIVHVADVHFTYLNDDDTQVNALLIGTTVDSGDFWGASVLGLSTTGSTDDYRPMLVAMTHTQQSNPDWTASQNARHEQIMADIARRTEEMTNQHVANMAAIQSSGARHQQKMEGLWAANDASVANFYDRMATGDATQRGFLNYINDENTVASSSGQQFQVDDSYQRYWMDTSTGSYVGGDVNFGDTQLRELGLDPGSYEEVQVVR